MTRRIPLNPRDPALYDFLVGGITFHPETLDVIAERDRLKSIAASGMKGCTKARQQLRELRLTELRGGAK